VDLQRGSKECFCQYGGRSSTCQQALPHHQAICWQQPKLAYEQQGPKNVSSSFVELAIALVHGCVLHHAKQGGAGLRMLQPDNANSIVWDLHPSNALHGRSTRLAKQLLGPGLKLLAC